MAGGEFVPDAGETYGWWLYTGDGGTVPLGHELNTILADQGFVVRPPRVAVTEPAASAQVIPEGTHPGLTARGLPVSYIDIRTGEPAEPPPRQWQPTRLVTIPE